MLKAKYTDLEGICWEITMLASQIGFSYDILTIAVIIVSSFFIGYPEVVTSQVIMANTNKTSGIDWNIQGLN
ncbi:MAG: hypothetical protein AAGF85_00475 [Bacteroidota bacterium]